MISYLLKPQSYAKYEQDEKIPQAKHRQLEMYLYGLENNTQQIEQVEVLISELFKKTVHILKENIEKQETDLQNLSVSLIFSGRTKKESILSLCLAEYSSSERKYSQSRL